MKLTINVEWEQVKGAVGEREEKAAEVGWRPKEEVARPLDMDEAVEVLEELIEAAKERRRAQELRDLAERLRTEAMLVDVAARGGEQRVVALTQRARELGPAQRRELGLGGFLQ